MRSLLIVSLLALLLIAADPPPGASATPLPDVGLSSGVECWNCAPFTTQIRLTSYDPMRGAINCFDFHDAYCWSPMASGLPWKAFWGLAAACPQEWPTGSWIDVPGVGRFICLDHGGLIVCDELVPDDRYAISGLRDYLPESERQHICAVDIMGPAGQWWNGQYFTATLWVPLQPR